MPDSVRPAVAPLPGMGSGVALFVGVSAGLWPNVTPRVALKFATRCAYREFVPRSGVACAERRARADVSFRTGWAWPRHYHAADPRRAPL